MLNAKKKQYLKLKDDQKRQKPNWSEINKDFLAKIVPKNCDII